MSGEKWTTAQLASARKAYNSKPEWQTDYTLAGELVSVLHKSSESIRWQLRQFRRDANAVMPPKILILDIETLPIEALVWDVWKQNVYMEQIEKDWSILCWSAKWLFDRKVMGGAVTAEEAKAHTDNSVLSDIWNLMNEADAIIWHNGNNFDAKKLNWRFFVAGMPKPMYYQSIDTKKIMTDNFSATYNKLDWVAQVLGIGRKIETEFIWWKECHQGNQVYLDKMLKYNKWDVSLEEEVYLRLRPWMEKHPNLNLFSLDSDTPHCPACGSLNLRWSGKYATPLGLYNAFRCQDCAAIGRSTLKAYKLNSSKVSN
jgi:hypothetical protein